MELILRYGSWKYDYRDGAWLHQGGTRSKTAGVVGLQPEARIFNLQFYDSDILKIDLIPCYRKSDGEIGMYDLVNSVFYTNDGTGTFLKGNNV